MNGFGDMPNNDPEAYNEEDRKGIYKKDPTTEVDETFLDEPIDLNINEDEWDED